MANIPTRPQSLRTKYKYLSGINFARYIIIDNW